jgi:hypothetical protein
MHMLQFLHTSPRPPSYRLFYSQSPYVLKICLEGEVASAHILAEIGLHAVVRRGVGRYTLLTLCASCTCNCTFISFRSVCISLCVCIRITLYITLSVLFSERVRVGELAWRIDSCSTTSSSNSLPNPNAHRMLFVVDINDFN